MSSITIDGAEYAIDSLSESARAQLASIQAVDRRLSDLREQVAIIQTARMAYVSALRQECVGESNSIEQEPT